MHLKTPFASLLSLILLSFSISKTVSAQSFSPWPTGAKANLTQCMFNVLNQSLQSYEPFWIDRNGQRTFDVTEAIGTNYDTCKAYCGTSNSAFQWGTFSPQFTGWLLPFLALAAQLPFESDGTWHNLMSLFMTIGSPQLAMYSLALTILNSRFAKRRLDEVFAVPPHSPPELRLMIDGLKDKIFKTLKISQQQPFELGNLVDVQGIKLELRWWTTIQETLAQNARWFTASLATQAAWAIIAFSFTWVDAFGSEEIGTNITAFGLAIALCWSWVTVLVLGWYFAGVSVYHRPISLALKHANQLYPKKASRILDFERRRGPAYTVLSRRIAGDAERSGPLYNYAKAFVWSHMADHLIKNMRRCVLEMPGRPPTPSRSIVVLPPTRSSTMMDAPSQQSFRDTIARRTANLSETGTSQTRSSVRSNSNSPSTSPANPPSHFHSNSNSDSYLELGVLQPVASTSTALPPRSRANRTNGSNGSNGDNGDNVDEPPEAPPSTPSVVGLEGVTPNVQPPNPNQQWPWRVQQPVTQPSVHNSPPNPRAELRSLILTNSKEANPANRSDDIAVCRYYWQDDRQQRGDIDGDNGYNEDEYDHIHVYSPWKRSVHSRMLWAAVGAIILNVATVGSAFWLDFMTPSVGLGCRSGGVLIYWMTSYIIWITLVISARLSDRWSVQEVKRRLHLGRQPSTYEYALGTIAVYLRIFGKILAVLNTAWIIIHCLFEFTSFYDRCWCQTNRETAPWLFLDDAQIRSSDNVSERWLGLAIFTGTVCTGYIAFLGFWTSRRL